MKCRFTRREILFYISFAIYIASVVLDSSFFAENNLCESIFKWIRYLSYLGFLVIIITDKYTPKKFVFMLFTVLIIALVSIMTGGQSLFLSFLVFFSAKSMDMNRVMKIACITLGICLFVVVLGSQVGLIKDYMFDVTTRARHGLGFTWTTTAPIMFLFFEMLYIFIRKNKISLVEVLILELITYWFYLMTDTRMCFVVSVVTPIVLYVLKFFKPKREQGNNKISKHWFLMILPSLICVFSIAINVFYDANNSVWLKINSLLSGRLRLGHSGLQEYGISVFGQKIEWVGYSAGKVVGDSYNYVDCSYMQILLEKGRRG